MEGKEESHPTQSSAANTAMQDVARAHPVEHPAGDPTQTAPKCTKEEKKNDVADSANDKNKAQSGTENSNKNANPNVIMGVKAVTKQHGQGDGGTDEAQNTNTFLKKIKGKGANRNFNENMNDDANEIVDESKEKYAKRTEGSDRKAKIKNRKEEDAEESVIELKAIDQQKGVHDEMDVDLIDGKKLTHFEANMKEDSKGSLPEDTSLSAREDAKEIQKSGATQITGRHKEEVSELGLEQNTKNSDTGDVGKGVTGKETSGTQAIAEDNRNDANVKGVDRGTKKGYGEITKTDTGLVQVSADNGLGLSRQKARENEAKELKANAEKDGMRENLYGTNQDVSKATPQAASQAAQKSGANVFPNPGADTASKATVMTSIAVLKEGAKKIVSGSMVDTEFTQGRHSTGDQEAESVGGDEDGQDEPGVSASDVSAQRRTRRASARTLRSRGQRKEMDPDTLQAEKEDRERLAVKLKEMMVDLPRPVKTDNGLKLEIGETVFVEEDQLDSMKKKRMTDKELKPIEKLTFADVASFNRDQLRCYCFIYGCPRRKKSEMEIDMALSVCLWNDGDPDFVLAEYVPKNSKEPVPEDVAVITINAAKAAVKEAEEAAVAAAAAAAAEEAAAAEAAAKAAAVSSPIPENMELDQTENPNRSKRSGASKSADLSRETGDDSVSPSKSHAVQAGKSSTIIAGKNIAAISTPSSAKRPSMRHEAINTLPQTSRRSRSASRPIAVARVSVPIAAAPVMQNIALQNQTQAQIQGSLARNQSGGAGKSLKTNIPVQQLPKGYGTSFKQKVHARAAGEKFKAAYNGAGPATVTIVENAAAYFEGKDSPEVIRDQAKSYSRYQFNVDLLSEIFDGPPSDDEGNVELDTEKPEDDTQPNVMHEVGKRMRSPMSAEDTVAELEMWENSFRKLESETRETERANMRLFQRLERAETEEEVEAVKRDFERYHSVHLKGGPPPLVRRKLDKSLSPVVMPDNKCRILRFKVS